MNRDLTLDGMKGVAIIAMIIGHLSTSFTQFIFSFHMPLFFIAGGYVYKQKEIKAYFKSDLSRLILPYFVTVIMMLICLSALNYISGLPTDFKKEVLSIFWASGSPRHTTMLWADMPVIGAIWFLPAFLWCRQSFNLIKKNIKSEALVIAACVLISAVAVFMDTKWVNLPFAILPGLGGLFFYWVGYKIRSVGGFRAVPWYLVIVGGLFWVVSFLFCEMSMVRCFYSNNLICIIGAIGVYVVMYLIINVIPPPIAKPLLITGEYTLPILCFHLIDLNVPTAYIWGIHTETGRILYNMFLCLIGIVTVSNFKLGRQIFGIKKAICPNLLILSRKGNDVK